METTTKELIKNIVNFTTNRLFIMFVLVSVLFYVLVVNLFDIQIVNGAKYYDQAKKSTFFTHLAIEAPRGDIYDKFGRPLAVNEIAFAIKVDPTINSKPNPLEVLELIKVLEKNGESIIDDFPISEEPFIFLLDDSISREERWKKNMDLKENLDAEKCFFELREFFKIPEKLSNEDARKILSICSAVYLQRWHLESVKIAVDVKDVTVAALEERKEDFSGFYVDLDYLRKYPQGENFSHMIGYIRGISEQEWSEKEPLELGYTASSIVGQDGLEKAFEYELKGVDGAKKVEADKSGVIVSTDRVKEPVQGNKIITTIDVDLQNKAVDIIKSYLKEILINKLRGTAYKEAPITAKELLASVVDANNISLDDIMNSSESYSAKVRELIEEGHLINKDEEDYKKNLKKFVSESIESGYIPVGYMMLVMKEQGIITLSEDEIENHSRGNNYVLNSIINKIENDEITPQMTNLKPSTGSVVMTDIKTGEILVAASYPGYDNNELVNNFNNAYYYKLMNDPTTPTIYRAFNEPRAPGSTFKMITAIATLETGAINTNTYITDRGEFREASWPYLWCWKRNYPYHGTINVVGALEGSCNYFFAQAMYNMGNATGENRYEGIEKLNKYMELFGLNERTGSEMQELYDFQAYTSRPDDVLNVASPSNKAYVELERTPELTESEVRWRDGDSVRTAIGQSYNNYTTASMAKYIATIATKGDRYQLHFLDSIESSDGEVISKFEPNLEEHLDVKDENWEAVYDGMLAVTKGTQGTARTVFQDFPITIGAKTGTAQEAAISHASFAAFAPFDDPQIAIYALIPNGDTLTMTAPAAQVARDVMAEYFGLDNEPQSSNMDNSLAK